MALRDWLPKWFKASPVTRAVVLSQSSPPQPVFTENNYAALAKEGYENNSTVFACINEIATSIAGIPWKLFKVATDGTKTELLNHPVLDLIHTPNPFQTGPEFFEALMGFLLIDGNSYMSLAGPDNPNAPPKELWLLRPDRVKVIPHAVDFIGGYEHRAGGYVQTFKPWQVIQLKTFSAMNDFYGTAPMKAAARIIDMDNSAVKWNVSLLQNEAKPSGAWTTEARLDTEQHERVKKELAESYGGPSNAGGMIFLNGGNLKWQQMSLSPSDLDWLQGRKQAKKDICQAFQVPPELIGDPDNKTYNSYPEARKAFYLETILPAADKLQMILNMRIVRRFGPGLQLQYDKGGIEALQEDKGKLIERLATAWWMTLNEKRLEQGLDEIEGGDRLFIPAGLLPMGTDGQDATDTQDPMQLDDERLN